MVFVVRWVYECVLYYLSYYDVFIECLIGYVKIKLWLNEELNRIYLDSIFNFLKG